MGQHFKYAKHFLQFSAADRRKVQSAKANVCRSMNAPDRGAQLGELFLNTFVTTIQVVYAIDHRLALRDQAGDN